jgi:phage-like element pbsx protein xkdM
MENKFSPEKAINGTYGELWLDDYYLAEALSLEAKATLEKTEVNQARTLVKGYKITGIDCKGTIKLNKVTSYFLTKLSDSIKKGKVVKCTIISKLADPDSEGVERVKLTGCVFDEITLANWEVKKLGEESIPFTFTGWEVLDSIPSL